jgi:hypothetical protein
MNADGSGLMNLSIMPHFDANPVFQSRWQQDRFHLIS